MQATATLMLLLKLFLLVVTEKELRAVTASSTQNIFSGPRSLQVSGNSIKAGQEDSGEQRPLVLFCPSFRRRRRQ